MPFSLTMSCQRLPASRASLFLSEMSSNTVLLLSTRLAISSGVASRGLACAGGSAPPMAPKGVPASVPSITLRAIPCVKGLSSAIFCTPVSSADCEPSSTGPSCTMPTGTRLYIGIGGTPSEARRCAPPVANVSMSRTPRRPSRFALPPEMAAPPAPMARAARAAFCGSTSGEMFDIPCPAITEPSPTAARADADAIPPSFPATPPTPQPAAIEGNDSTALSPVTRGLEAYALATSQPLVAGSSHTCWISRLPSLVARE